MQVREHAKNEFVAKQAHTVSCSSVKSITFRAILVTLFAGCGLTTTTAAAHAAGMCRAAYVARGGGFIAGYGLYKLGLLAGPGGDGTSKLGLTGRTAKRSSEL